MLKGVKIQMLMKKCEKHLKKNDLLVLKNTNKND